MSLELPTFNDTTAIAKSDISSYPVFKEYVELCGLTVLSVEDDYYILKGSIVDIKNFNEYWNYSNE